MKRLLCVMLAVLMLCVTVPVSATNAPTTVTVLFTHDLHSHFLPSRDTDGGEFGGYARLMTVIKEQQDKFPDAILVDGGDFSMGSLFQTAFAAEATELRLMGAMGYDVTTFGNHEFDYLPKGLASMLNVAKDSGDPLPAIVDANYLPPKEGEEGYTADSAMMHKALDNYGVEDYVLLERGGVYIAVFGIMGVDSDDCAPNSGMVFADPIATAQATVDAAIADCKATYQAEPVVVCLSHSGTSGREGEDYELAKQVTGIDLIVSGHTHSTLETPITVGNTHIVSAGEYGRFLGVANLAVDANGIAAMTSYELIPVDETVKDDAAVLQKVDQFKKAVEDGYLHAYGFGFDEVVADNPYTFDTVDEVYDTQHESTLGNLFADAYKAAVENATGEPVDVALTAAGVIRETLPLGDVTVSDVFNAASLGVGTEGELIAVYITGEELKNALEVDASVQPIMRSAQLFFSGVEYSFNTRRMIFNKVDYAMLRRADGTLEDIDDDKMYRIVTGMYAGQMLGSVKEKSFGLLSITPKDKDGNPLSADELVNYVVGDENGNPVKEWYAIASYLKDMGGTIDAQYEQPDGRKVVYASLAPTDMLRNANKFTVIAIGVIVLVIGGVTWLIVALVRRKTKKADKNESKE